MGQLTNTPKIVPIFLARAKSFSFGLWFKATDPGDNLHLVDLTDATITFVLAETKRKGATVLLTQEADLTDPTVGTAAINLQAEDLDLTPGVYDYSITLVTAEEYSYEFMGGEVEIQHSVNASTTNSYSSDDPNSVVHVLLTHDNRVTVHMEKGLKGDDGEPGTTDFNDLENLPDFMYETTGVGGVLSGDALNPGFAENMAYQHELETAIADLLTAIDTAKDDVKAEILGGAGPAWDTLQELKNLLTASDNADDAAIAAILTQIGELENRVDEWVLAHPGNVAGHTVALIGASITYLTSFGAGKHDPVTTEERFASNGAFSWAKTFLGGRLQLLANFGVGGHTSTQILAQCYDVIDLPEKPTWVIVGEPAINGINTAVETAAQIIDNLEEIITLLTSHGMNVCLQTTAPSDAITGAELTAVAEVNQWTRLQGGRPGVVVADIEPVLINHLTGAPKANTTYDGSHWTNLGGILAGKVLADALSPYVGGSVDLASTNVDPASATANPMMVGTGGTKAAGVTGELADSWSTNWYGSGAAFVSKVPATDHVGGEWQRIKVNANTAGLLMLQTLMPGVVAGATYVAEGEFRTQDWVDMTMIALQVYPSDNDFVMDLSASLSPAALPSPGWGVWRTPEWVAPEGLTYVSVAVIINGTNGTIDVRRVRLRRIA